MAHVQHPKDLFKAIARENMPKEGDCARPGGLPVVLELGEVDDAHVENDGKETLKVGNRDRFPLCKP